MLGKFGNGLVSQVVKAEPAERRRGPLDQPAPSRAPRLLRLRKIDILLAGREDEVLRFSRLVGLGPLAQTCQRR